MRINKIKSRKTIVKKTFRDRKKYLEMVEFVELNTIEYPFFIDY